MASLHYPRVAGQPAVLVETLCRQDVRAFSVGPGERGTVLRRHGGTLRELGQGWVRCVINQRDA